MSNTGATMTDKTAGVGSVERMVRPADPERAAYARWLADLAPALRRMDGDGAHAAGYAAGVAAERERCAMLCEAARPLGGREWSTEQAACFDALTHVAQQIRNA